MLQIHWSLPEPPVAKLALFGPDGRPLFQCLPGDEPKGADLLLLGEAANLRWALARMIELHSKGQDDALADHIRKASIILGKAGHLQVS